MAVAVLRRPLLALQGGQPSEASNDVCGVHCVVITSRSAGMALIVLAAKPSMIDADLSDY